MSRPEIQMTPDGRMTARNAALYLGVSENTLQSWRSNSKGPKYLKLEGKIFYKKDSLDRYIQAADESQ